jgi:hypothetical protein
MAESQTIPRPSILWKQMSIDQRRQAVEAFWQDESGKNEQTEAIATISQRFKIRTKSVVVLPLAKKIKYLLELPGIPEAVAARILMSHHIEYRRPLMAAFLDALGIAHDNGMIPEDTVIPKEPEKLRAAVNAIAASFPAEDVALYLSTLTWQDPETWSVLADYPEAHIPGKW